MGTMQRVRVILSGFPGGPGVSTFYFIDAATALPALHAFWDQCVGNMPTTVQAQVQNTGDVVSDVDGSLTGSWSGPAQLPLSGVRAGSYAAPSGLCVTWGTNVILDHHHVRGRTFVVPLGGACYQSDGSLDNAVVTSLETAAFNLITAPTGNLLVWHRPRKATATLTAHPGSQVEVVSGVIRDKVVVLRSRRD